MNLNQAQIEAASGCGICGAYKGASCRTLLAGTKRVLHSERVTTAHAMYKVMKPEYKRQIDKLQQPEEATDIP